jgi:HD-GYP domain-containing protein (c-di-GMP phosphodiesterase class II)
MTSGTSEIGLAELVSALSYALDMTEGQPAGHGVRCCWIGLNIGRETGMSEAELSELYYMLLLKDAGCSSNAARICQLYLGDDIGIKRDFKLVDSSLANVFGFVLKHTGMKAGLAERFRAIFHLALSGGEIVRELIEARCHQGADIAHQMRFSDAVVQGILDLDEHWDGKGRPLGLVGETISPFARIGLLAQVVDVFFTSAGPAAALEEVRRRAGIWFDPAMVVAFERIATPEFWEALASADLEGKIVAIEKTRRVIAVDEDYLDDIAGAFAKVVDAKSPFTSGHSDRVALFSDLIAEELGFDDQRRRTLKRAALLHDIGKLGVSNQVLDKPGKLDDLEWAEIKQHPAIGERILSHVAAFAPLARIAGEHHERLDGKGYPKGLTANDLGLETRIVTVADVFDALTADRPYRGAMPVQEAMAIMEGMVGPALDSDVFGALGRAVDKLTPELERTREAA